MSGKREPMIHQLLLRELLVDVEKSGKTREEFGLVALCNQKPHAYGAESSETRRKVGLTFGNIKRKDPLSYRQYLDKHNVAPGEALQRLIRVRPSLLYPTGSIDPSRHVQW